VTFSGQKSIEVPATKTLNEGKTWSSRSTHKEDSRSVYSVRLGEASTERSIW